MEAKVTLKDKISQLGGFDMPERVVADQGSDSDFGLTRRSKTNKPGIFDVFGFFVGEGACFSRDANRARKPGRASSEVATCRSADSGVDHGAGKQPGHAF